MKRNYTVCLVIVGAIILSVCLGTLWLNSEKRADRIFERDYDELVQVVEYFNSLENTPYAHINTDGTMVVEIDDNVANTDNRVLKKEITDERVLNLVSNLYKKGYDSIVKDDNNTIYFVRWRHPIFGWDKGFAFSVDGSKDLDIEYLVDQKPLSKSDWYYFESDYEEWRENNNSTK